MAETVDKNAVNSFSLVPEIADFVIQYEHVGSRVTCDPVSTGTDDDWLVLVPESNSICEILLALGWTVDGSHINCPIWNSVFHSMSSGELNLIITDKPDFYRRFLAATHVAKKLNLLKKEDRIALFQACLYGNKK